MRTRVTSDKMEMFDTHLRDARTSFAIYIRRKPIASLYC